MNKIYHNPRCTKSRQALELLENKGIKPQIIEYLKNPPTKKELLEIITLLNIDATKLLRTKEDEYKELVEKEGKPNNEMAIDWMLKVPKLMERPIVITKKGARIGRPIENILEII